MQKWEYLWIYVATDLKDKSRITYVKNGQPFEARNHADALNQAGHDGWELVGMSITSQSFPQFFLKRPISD